MIKLIFREQIAREWNKTNFRRKVTVCLATLGAGLLLLSVLALTGCGTTQAPITKAAFGAAVTLGEQFALESHPEATPYVKIAANVVCAQAGGTNVNPADIVAALSKAGITNSQAKLIVNSSLALYNIVFSYVGTNQPVLQEYAQVLCDAMNAGLPSENTTTRRMPLAAPHLK